MSRAGHSQLSSQLPSIRYERELLEEADMPVTREGPFSHPCSISGANSRSHVDKLERQMSQRRMPKGQVPPSPCQLSQKEHLVQEEGKGPRSRSTETSDSGNFEERVPRNLAHKCTAPATTMLIQEALVRGGLDSLAADANFVMATGQALADACQMEPEEVEVAATELLKRESPKGGAMPREP